MLVASILRPAQNILQLLSHEHHGHELTNRKNLLTDSQQPFVRPAQERNKTVLCIRGRSFKSKNSLSSSRGRSWLGTSVWWV